VSIRCKFERSILSYDEHEIILRSHHPEIYDAGAFLAGPGHPRLGCRTGAARRPRLHSRLLQHDDNDGHIAITTKSPGPRK
jgi:hypothetical protein